MFESNRQRGAEITLCLFPHLKEFLVVDARRQAPGGGTVRLLTFDQIFTEEFLRSVETGFSELLRRKDAGLIEMIGIPQEVETLVRSESLKRVIKSLNSAAGISPSGAVEGIGVLFFTRGLLAIQPDQLQVAMRELFGSALPSQEMGMLTSELTRLIDEERKAEETSMQSDVSRLITGKSGAFLTLWENERKRE